MRRSKMDAVAASDHGLWGRSYIICKVTEKEQEDSQKVLIIPFIIQAYSLHHDERVKEQS